MSVRSSSTTQLIALAIVLSTLGILLGASNIGQACVDGLLSARGTMQTTGDTISAPRVVTFAGIIH